ncbi:MAG: serine protease, partial [Verrucomicrobia bacterium]|nr:serine protease [Verrucomicrobiota bacterium]
ELIALGVGLGLIALELFVLPGFGVAGILGILLAGGALVVLLLPGLRKIDFSWKTGSVNAAFEVVIERLAYLGGALILGVFLMFFLSRYVLPKMTRFSKLILHEDQTGYIATLDMKQLPPVGQQGVAKTVLRPAGKVEIGDLVYDAVSIGSFIDKGAAVEVVRYEGSRMVVKRCSS